MSQKLITTEQIERLRASLTEAPPKPRSGYGVREIVAELAPMLLDMRQKGYNLADMITYFNQQDITISASTLGSYLRDHEREKQNRKGKSRSPRQKATKIAGASRKAEQKRHDDNGGPDSDTRPSAMETHATRSSPT